MPPPANGRSGTSVGQVFAAVAGFLALAAIGAAIGWGVTKAPVKPTNGPSLSPSPSVSASSPNPPSSPPASPTSSANVLLDYTGQDFPTVRQELRSLKLGVTLVFDATGPAGTTVRATVPPAGTPIHSGLTIKVFVNGTAPLLPVPPLPTTPTTCADWGKFLADTGFNLSYTPPGSKNLKVAAETPGPGDTSTVWNETITLTCTPDGQLPPSSPPASAPASAPASGGTNQ